MITRGSGAILFCAVALAIAAKRMSEVNSFIFLTLSLPFCRVQFDFSILGRRRGDESLIKFKPAFHS
jgi:hypothetical protein